MRVGIAADHGGCLLKEDLGHRLRKKGAKGRKLNGRDN
jgi:hypothetical protein